jgi:uncharacterized membrane protein YeaQ/YmgE (transglycosylase-associated protein family)
MGLLISLLFGLVAGATANAVLPIQGRRSLLIPIFLGVLGAAFGVFVGTRLGLGTMYGFDIRNIGVAAGISLIVLTIYRLITDGLAPAWPPLK